MNSRFIVLILGLFGAVALPASTHYWVGGSGSWYDPANWSPASVPAPTDACRFRYEDHKGPADITYGGLNVSSDYVHVEAKSGVTSNNGTFEKTVYLRGQGALHQMNGSGAFEAGYRRKLVLDNLTQHGGGGYFKIQGKASVVNGCVLMPDYANNLKGALGSSCLVPGYAGSRFVLDNSYYYPYCFSPDGGGGKVIVRHNSFLTWDRSWTTQSTWATVDFDFTTGTIITAATYPLYSYKMLPKRPGGVLVSCNGGWTGASFVTSGDTVVRLGGEAYFTNSVADSSQPALFTFTNSVTMYGRGKLFATISSSDGMTNVYDLSEISTRSIVQNASLNPATYFGDTLFSCHGIYSTGLSLGGTTYFPGAGARTFDLLEKWGRKDKKRDLSISRLKASAQAKIVIRNANTATINYRVNNDTHGGLELGADVPLIVTDSEYIFTRHQFEGLKMAAGSSIKTGTSDYNFVMVYGEAELDPTAKFIRRSTTLATGAAPLPLLATYDDDVTEPLFELSTETAGCSVHRVGGSFFYGDGQYTPSAYSGAEWTGGEDGLWSNTNNWSNSQLLKDRTTCFTGFRHTVCTNDIDNMLCWRLINGTDDRNTVAGPFILRGKPITVGAGDGQIKSYSSYPFIVENDIVGTTAGDFQVKARGDTINPSPIVLRGTVAVANGSFSPDGQVVIQGTVNAKDLHLRNWSGKTYEGGGGDFPTRLRVERGGTVNIAAQTTVLDATASFFISAGGAVNLTGNWTCTSANDSVVNGTLAVSGLLGGSATQGYYGAGVVKAGSLDGSGGASVKLGDGVTLLTTAAGTTAMPILLPRGDATVAAAAPTEFAGGIRVDALGHTLTVSNDVTVTVSGAITGADFDFVKAGSGRLVLAEAPGLTNGYAKIAGGTLALTKPVTMGQLTAAAGATLELVADADGKAPMLSLNDDLDLSNLTVELSGAPTAGLWQTLVTVGEDLRITGTPNVPGFAVRIVRNADDTVSLAVRPKRGLALFVR